MLTKGHSPADWHKAQRSLTVPPPKLEARNSDREISLGPGTVQNRAHWHLQGETDQRRCCNHDYETNALLVDLHWSSFLRRMDRCQNMTLLYWQNGILTARGSLSLWLTSLQSSEKTASHVLVCFSSLWKYGWHILWLKWTRVLRSNCKEIL